MNFNLNDKFSLDELSDPSTALQPLQIERYEPELLLKHLTDMLRIRFVEHRLAEGKRDSLIGGPVHLGVGQEAVAVGVSANLRKTDRVFGAHRSHSHILALTGNAHKLFAEVLGKRTGYSKGMGGSMHLWSQPDGFYGSVPIVAGTVPLAVGAGLAAKLQSSGDVAIAYLGDGAMEEGVVHESLNLARIQNIPVIFIVENNLFASHMHISIRQPLDATARFAKANEIPYHVIDGNDITEVLAASDDLISSARTGRGPGFLEAVTYRWYGHVDWREDVDVGVSRSKDLIDMWKLRDPIARLKRAMLDANLLSEDQITTLESQLKDEINAAWQKALSDPFPDQTEPMNNVYSMQ